MREDGRIDLVLELMHGGELYEHVMKKGRLAEDEAHSIFVQILGENCAAQGWSSWPLTSIPTMRMWCWQTLACAVVAHHLRAFWIVLVLRALALTAARDVARYAARHSLSTVPALALRSRRGAPSLAGHLPP